MNKQRKVQVVSLRNADQISDAYEWLHAQQKAGTIDATRANGMNATLKGVKSLRVDVPLKLIELGIKAHKSKAELPASFAQVLSHYSDVLIGGGKKTPVLTAAAQPKLLEKAAQK